MTSTIEVNLREEMLVKPVGIIPAAGRGTRLLPFRYPKELFPIAYDDPSSQNGDVQLRIVCQDALDSLSVAGIAEAYVIISDQKFEVMRFLSNGQEFGVHLAYLHQREINGLPFAIDCAYNWVKERNCVLLLPDTLLEPRDAVRRAIVFLEEKEADVVLGVFPTDHPEDLCPVDFDTSGRVRSLHDKDASKGIMNTWGFVVWNPTFTAHLHGFVNDVVNPPGRELTLADVITTALETRLSVFAFPIDGGKFMDIGKSSSLIEARQILEERIGEIK